MISFSFSFFRLFRLTHLLLPEYSGYTPQHLKESCMLRIHKANQSFHAYWYILFYDFKKKSAPGIKKVSVRYNW